MYFSVRGDRRACVSGAKELSAVERKVCEVGLARGAESALYASDMGSKAFGCCQWVLLAAKKGWGWRPSSCPPIPRDASEMWWKYERWRDQCNRKPG